jgi:hypothetical protein
MRRSYILRRVAKHLLAIDEAALEAARADLGTVTMNDTVSEALRRAGSQHTARVHKSLNRFGNRGLPPREEAWR